jgi:hypothetical protein
VLLAHFALVVNQEVIPIVIAEQASEGRFAEFARSHPDLLNDQQHALLILR